MYPDNESGGRYKTSYVLEFAMSKLRELPADTKIVYMDIEASISDKTLGILFGESSMEEDKTVICPICKLLDERDEGSKRALKNNMPEQLFFSRDINELDGFFKKS